MTLTTLTLQGKRQEAAMCLLPSCSPPQAGREGCVTMRAQASALLNIELNTPLILMPQFNVVNKGEFNVILG